MAGSVDLRNQVAMVTGASQSLGRAFAQALALAGASVAVTARSEEGLAETVRLIGDAGGRAIAVPAEGTDRRAVEAAVATARKVLGPVDILVNSAGSTGPLVPTWEADPDAWWRAVEVNLRTHFLFTYAVLPDMLARLQGRIINMSSGVVYGPSPYTSAYSAAKTGLTNFTGVLAAEVREHGISVLAYAPGTVRTAMAEYALSSPEVHKPFQEAFRQTYARGLDTPLEAAVERLMLLASGRLDALSGRLIDISNDEADLLRQAAEAA